MDPGFQVRMVHYSQLVVPIVALEHLNIFIPCFGRDVLQDSQ
jgi:hypothetical protein